GQGHEGGIFTVEAPIHASNVQVIDPVTGRPCKVGTKYLEDGTKVRVSRGIGASGSIIPRPEILKIRTTPRPSVGKSLLVPQSSENAALYYCKFSVPNIS
ncbi:50S ribosomal protein l24-like, partial [Trifolium pratense]